MISEDNIPWKYVIKNNLKALSSYLLLETTDVNSTISLENNTNLLMNAVSEQKMQIIDLQLQHPLQSINAVDSFGKSAIHYASANGDIETQELLVKHNADINLQNKAGETAFMKACYFVEKETIMWFLEETVEKYDLNLNIRNFMGDTAEDILRVTCHLRDDIQINDKELEDIMKLFKHYSEKKNTLLTTNNQNNISNCINDINLNQIDTNCIQVELKMDEEIF